MEENEKPTLFEGTSLIGKIFFASLGAYLGASLLGKIVKTKIRGSEDQINAIYNAMLASKRFQDELKKPGATVNSVIEKLNVKHMSVREFERVFGVSWPL
jgi:hypothetical protein